jgi:hypothetical protein
VRLVLLALVAVNVAFFAWAHWIDAPAVIPAATARDTSIPPLQLATKSPAPTAPAPAAATTSTAAPASAAPSVASASAPVRCRSLGPFEDMTAVNAAADRLRARGFTPHDRSADTQNPNVYWVYIGELTVEMQRHAIQALNAAGIHDAASMPQPEMSDRVSVGVFADQAHAVKRAEQVRALGFKPTLGLRQRTVPAHWLDFELKSGDSDPQPVELIGTPIRPGLGLGPVKLADCPAESGNG